jgi:hypothetical protein
METGVGIQGVTETELTVRKSAFIRKRFMKNCYLEFYENPQDDCRMDFISTRAFFSFVKEAYLQMPVEVPGFWAINRE